MKKILLTSLLTLSLVSIGFWVQPTAASLLRQSALNLQVDAIKQSMANSCGEAVITMAYNYAHPQTPLTEAEVIKYAAAQGYFIPHDWPFTSPANMVNLVRHYTFDYSTGNVMDSNQGLVLLFQKLQSNEPVILDVLTRLDDPESGAHFILVTGLSIDPGQTSPVTVSYNDPLSGEAKTSPWTGSDGIWNAWQNNGDPNGAGWWLAIASLP